ncbi:hypothetical protein BJ944DRAFT_272433 [Cunninghamella echinulata]|nr:hypothetical protein BJ944DRAFT_272433 [Cunninghamella echinulata]
MKLLNFFLFCFLLFTNHILTGEATATVTTTTTTTTGITRFSAWANNNGIWKRDTGLPYEALPANNNCQAPKICSQLNSMNNNNANIQCRCNDILTICKNNVNQYCWGSVSLHNTNCPTIPDPCHTDFNSTVSCLCNDKNVLCIDQYNHYCYGTIHSSNSSQTSVSIQPLIPPASSSPSSPFVLSSSLAASQTALATETPSVPSMAISFGYSSTILFTIMPFVLIFIYLL